MAVVIGTNASEFLQGTASPDVIAGLDGDDRLFGNGGADEMIGGLGNDVYVVSDAGSTLVEYAGEGIDGVWTALTFYRLPLHVEYVEFQSGANSSGVGNDLNNSLLGGVGADELHGLGGNDTLWGYGGPEVSNPGAANTLIGGTGDDSYRVFVQGDSVIEYADEGTDTVYTTIGSYTLPVHVEDLRFSGTGSFVGIGNDGNNNIFGSTARDSLSGLGGRDFLEGGDGAANELAGGTGDDVYYSTAAGDTIVEYAGEGYDFVNTNLASFILPANTERLNFFGTGAFFGIGNNLDNIMTGGTAGDILIGLDGDDLLTASLFGNDSSPNTMIGGTGSDQYNVDTPGDSVIELAGEGHDTVSSSVSSYVLPDHVENLFFTSDAAPVVGIGNALDNVISSSQLGSVLLGLDGNDTLSGSFGSDRIYGGSGNDRMTGSGGADYFFLSGSEAGVDILTDFTSGTDLLYLDRASYGATANFDFLTGFGSLPTPTSTNTTLLYETGGFTLWLDADGTGPTAAIQLLQFTNGQVTSTSDFVFY